MSTRSSSQHTTRQALLAALVDLAACGLIDMTLAQFVGVATADSFHAAARRYWPKLEEAVRQRTADLNGIEVLEPGSANDADLDGIFEVLGSNASSALNDFESRRIVPLAATDDSLVFVTGTPPSHIQATVAQRYTNGRRLVWKLAPPSSIDRQLAALRSHAVSGGDEEEEFVDEVSALVTTSPAVQWVDSLLRQAVAEGASDIHVSPVRESRWKVRLRIDGVLVERPAPPTQMAEEIVNRFIHIAGMDNTKADKVPQDGRIRINFNRRQVDLRVATGPVMVPSPGREGSVSEPSVVARILDPINIDVPLDDMGFAPDTLAVLRRHTSKRQGAVIISGPTGSGKTTTLYAIMKEVYSPAINIMTVEDPVEYQLAGISQIQVNHTTAHRVDFASALRAMMRLDPDVILVGEIRDLETAKTAADAAITGHLVFSTVHAPSAPEVFTRLIQLQVDPYTVAQALSVTTAQRLLRRVCDICAVRRAPTDKEAVFMASVQERFGVSVPEEVASAVGCPNCRDTGYRGRAAYAEVLEVDEGVRELVIRGAASSELVAYAREHLGYRTLAEDAWRHVLAGDTTLEEYSRAVDAKDA